jgi:ring-1,2-phenylacetyl-CoA epoxidase subunit PaaC
MTASIQPKRDLPTQYVLRLADTCLILAQRLGEWCGHAPIIEEDIAITNMALDLIGQSRGLLTLAGEMNQRVGGERFDEDQLAFLRDERDYLNPTLVELPRGDFAFTVLRNAMVATYLTLVWEKLADSSEPELAAIAGKAVKESRYHLQHASDWVLRLGDGTDDSARRLRDALAALWRYSTELFTADAVDEAAAAAGIGPRTADLREAWLAEMTALLSDVGLAPPAPSSFVSTGKQGVHTEAMGYLLTQMQYLQRTYPGGVW